MSEDKNIQNETVKQPVSDGGGEVITLMKLLGKSKDLQGVRPGESELMKEWRLSIQDGKLNLGNDLEDKAWPSLPSFEDKTKVTALAVLLKDGDKRVVVVQDIEGPKAIIDFARDFGQGTGLQVASSGGLEKDDMQWLAEEVREVQLLVTGTKGNEWSIMEKTK